MTLKDIRDLTGRYIGGFGCDGRHFNACKSGMSNKSEFRKIPNEVLYHCPQPGCSFDFCEKCYETYKNAHNHVLEKTTWDKLPSNYASGWLCDSAVFFKGCASQGNYNIFNHDNTVLYHDPICDFDLCELCMQAYKAK